MENIVVDSITIVVDSLAMVADFVAIGVSLYTYYKTYSKNSSEIIFITTFGYI